MFSDWLPFLHLYRNPPNHYSCPHQYSSNSSGRFVSQLLLLFAAFTIFAKHCDGQQHQQQFGDLFENRRGGTEPSRPAHCTESWQYPCDDGQHCIARYDECDGIEQCPDGSDEKHCQQSNERASLSNGHGRNYYDTQQQQQQQHGREDQAVHHQQQQEQNAQEKQRRQQEEQRKSTTKKTIAARDGAVDKRVPLELLLAGAAAFVFVSALVHAVMKATRRRRLAARGTSAGANRRGFRKGERLVDEEDDLLIAQMYG